MEGLYDVVFTFRDKVVFIIEGVPSLERAISILESIHLRYKSILKSINLKYEIGIIYGYDEKGLRYIVHKKEQHFGSAIGHVA